MDRQSGGPLISAPNIVALSSGPPPSAIAVIRLSGPDTESILDRLVDRQPQPRTAALRDIRDPLNGELIDRGIVVWYPGPGSFSGEDCVEFQVHGSRAVISRLLLCLCDRQGVRLAQAGEFTRRAFENGNMDLSEVEGLADLIASDTEAQRQQALRQIGGTLAKACHRWRQQLIDARAWIEAGLDFADEDDVPSGVSQRHWKILEELRDSFVVAMDDQHRGERIRDGLQIVILGRPNAGKSSLLNALALRDAAIVTEEAGTTRDIVEIAYDIGGFPARLLDTAGLRAASGQVELEGMRRARAAAKTADLVLWISDGRQDDRPDEEIEKSARQSDTPLWYLINKIDLPDLFTHETSLESKTKQIRISAKYGDGLDDLLACLEEFARTDLRLGEPVLITRLRHRDSLQRASREIESVLENRSLPAELIVEHIRRAGVEIGRIAGEIDVEDVLDRIFAEFCIGK
jgi:tRNA modification GTPase